MESIPRIINIYEENENNKLSNKNKWQIKNYYKIYTQKYSFFNIRTSILIHLYHGKIILATISQTCLWPFTKEPKTSFPQAAMIKTKCLPPEAPFGILSIPSRTIKIPRQ